MTPHRAAFSDRLFAVGSVVVVCLTVFAYAPALRAPLIYDDFQAIDHNPSIRSLWPLSVPLHPPATTSVSGRPLVNLSLAINYRLNDGLGIDQRPDADAPDKTFTYHLVNLALHICCGLLLLGIVRRTLGSAHIAARWRNNADPLALLIAAAWLLHPIQTEAVDYVIQRTEIIVSLCLLATLYCSIRAWDSARDASRRAWLSGAVITSALGMASKEVMVSAPIIMLLYDRAFRARSWSELFSRATGRRAFYGALAATWLILVALLWNHPRGVSVGPSGWMPPLEYLHTQGWAILHYLRLAVFPTGLSADYSYRAIEHWRGIPGLIVLALFGLTTVWTWTRANRWGWLGFLGAWFFLILAPSSSFVPIVTEPIAERRMYLPLAAIIVLVLAWCDAMAQQLQVRRPALFNTIRRTAPAAVALVLLFFLVATFQRSRLYQSPEMLWRDAIAKWPDNPRAWVNLGAVLAADVPPRRLAADSMFREALRRDSLYRDALLNVAIDELDTGDDAAAEAKFRRFLAVDSTNAAAFGGLAKLLLRQADTVAALSPLEHYAKLAPAVGPLMLLAAIYESNARDADALAVVRQAVALDPSNSDLVRRLAGMLLDHGRAVDAEPYLEDLVRREPGSNIDLALYSAAAADQGRVAEAVQAAERATQLGAPNEGALFYAGRAMAAVHRNELAERYLEGAIALDPRDVDALNWLAGVKDALGKKAEAGTLFRRALQIAPNDPVAKAGLARLR